jgi:hypothetical protein
MAIEPYAGSSDLTPLELRNITSGMRQATDLGAAHPCFSETGSQIACSKLADQFCENVWSPKHNGNLDNAVGKMRFGKSSKSDLDLAKKIDLEALMSCGPRLPKDLRTRLSPIQAKIKVLMKKERDSEDWYDALNQTEAMFWNEVKKGARARTLAKHPELTGIPKSDQSMEQQHLFATDLLDVTNEITAAKYERHPHWLRVARVFKDVKNDILHEIETWNVTPDVKTKLLEKIKSVHLQLPSSDPRVLSNDAEEMNCHSTLKNAYYWSEQRTFTMCAGYFNSIQNDAEIYRIIAHEVGHSIDADSQSSDEFMRSPVGRVVEKLCNATGPVYSCEEWDGLKKSVLAEPSKIELPTLPFSKLTACLKPTKDLADFDLKELRSSAGGDAAVEMDKLAAKKEFTDIALEEYEKNGATVKHKYFMRPDRVRAYNNGGVFLQRECAADSSVYLEVFTQELNCSGYVAKDPNRSEKFKEALKTTNEIGKAITENWYSFCGRECRNLTSTGMSRDTSEDTADWIAVRAISRLLKREQSLTKRREIATTAFARFCSSESYYRKAHDLLVEEKEYSAEEHPEDRKRILSVFTPEIIKAVSCAPDEDTEEASGKCEL